jgi:hypothetical protein
MPVVLSPVGPGLLAGLRLWPWALLGAVAEVFELDVSGLGLASVGLESGLAPGSVAAPPGWLLLGVAPEPLIGDELELAGPLAPLAPPAAAAPAAAPHAPPLPA